MVLWTLVLLSAIATSLTFTQRTELDLNRGLVERVQGRALAQAGVAHALYMLRLQDPAFAWKADGQLRRVRFAEHVLEITVYEEKGLVDVNQAPPSMLDKVFSAAGLDEQSVIRLIDAIGDWKDPDDQRRLHGAEAAQYRAAGYEYGPANAPFQDLSELRLVYGMTPELYLRVRDLLTVDSGQAAVKLSASSAGVRELLAGELLGVGDSVQLTADPRLPVRGAGGFVGGIADALIGGLRIRAEVLLAGARRYVAEATVVLDNRAEKGFYITKWHHFGLIFEPDGNAAGTVGWQHD